MPFLKVYSDPLFAGRLVSVFCGLGTILGVLLLTQYLFQAKKVTLIAGLIYTLSPFSLFFDSMALVDAMLAMFGVWTVFLATAAIKTRRLDFAMLAGFALGGALLTKSPGIYFALLLPSVILLSLWPKNLSGKLLHLIKSISLLIPTYFIGFAMQNIMRLGPNFQMLNSRNADYIYPLSHIFQRPLDPLVPFVEKAINWLWLLGPGILILLIVAGIFINFKKFKKEILFLIIWAFVPIFISAEYGKVFTARYIFFSLPFIFIIAASTLLSKKYKNFIKAFLVIFVVHAIYIDFLLLTNINAAPLPVGERSGYLEEWTAGTGIKEASEYIINFHKSKQDEKIIVGTEGYFGTLPDGLEIYLNSYPEITVIGVGLNLTKLPDSLKSAKDAGDTVFLVINSSRLNTNPENIGLKLLASYAKAFRKPGTREYNTLGPRENLYLFEVEDNNND